MRGPITFEAWLTTVPPDESADAVWRVQAYRRARFAMARTWPLATDIRRVPMGQPVATQLWRATAAIPADIAEGFSRSSVADRIRFLAYALGSTREALSWFAAAQVMLPEMDMSSPVSELRSIRNLLLKMVSSQRTRLSRQPRFG